MIFVELPLFSSHLKLTDDELRKVQADIITDPTRGDLARGGGGLRKLRAAIDGRGKSGGARVIYYMHGKDRCYLVFAYAKNVQGDLSQKQLGQLAAVVKKELEDG